METVSFNSGKSQELLCEHFTTCLEEASIGGFPFFNSTKNKFILNTDNKPVSVMLYRKISEELHELDFIAVLNENRGQGLAKALLMELKTSVWLEVHELNTRAIEFYNALGFKRVGLRKAYYGKNAAVLMEKKP